MSMKAVSQLDSQPSTNEWLAFWEQTNFWTYPELFRVNADLFRRVAKPILKFNSEDQVINIGCGPGYLEKVLAPEVASILAVDTSLPFLELCRKNNEEHSNVDALPLADSYTNLEKFNRKFSLFLCISIIQYYRSIEEVEALIRSAQNVALPGARMLIADMPRDRNFMGSLWDTGCSFVQSARKGYVGTLTQKIFRERKKILGYRNYADKVPHLIIDEAGFEKLIKRMGLRAEILKTNFSICANRLSLLIYF